MNESIQRANELHNQSQAIVDAFLKAGGKIIKQAIVKRKIPKQTINKPDREKPISKSETNVNKFERVIKTYMRLTSVEVCMYTGMASPEMFRCARKLQDLGVITRDTGKGMGGVTVFNLAKT